MTTKHTPGPWTYLNDNGVKRIDSKQGLITLLDNAFGEYLHDSVENDANANLIAAAPDLLAALQTILDAWEKNRPFSLYKNEIQTGRAAIAKATGGQ